MLADVYPNLPKHLTSGAVGGRRSAWAGGLPQPMRAGLRGPGPQPNALHGPQPPSLGASGSAHQVTRCVSSAPPKQMP